MDSFLIRRNRVFMVTIGGFVVIAKLQAYILKGKVRRKKRYQ